MTKDKVILELDKLLEQERDALFNGELQTLVELIERKRSLINSLNTHGISDPEELEPLQGKAARNQALLDSALRGIKSVSTRIAALQNARKSLETYDEKGRRKSINATQPNKLEKRA